MTGPFDDPFDDPFYDDEDAALNEEILDDEETTKPAILPTEVIDRLTGAEDTDEDTEDDESTIDERFDLPELYRPDE